MKIERVEEHLKEKLKDPYFKELYELEEQKLDIVKRIVAYRIKHDLAQKDLAKKANVSQQHISKIESGDFSSIITLEKILLFIGLTIKLTVVPLGQNAKRIIARKIHSRGKVQFA